MAEASGRLRAGQWPGLRHGWLAGLVLLLLGLSFLGTAAGATTITDDRGHRVSLDGVPARIVSVYPSLTEMVCQLGHCERLVGVDRYSNFPPSVRALPRVGGGLDPSVEAIVALRPDLVLLATSSPVAARLESLGLVVLALEPKQYADVRRVLEIMGQVLDARAQARRLWADIDAGVDAAARSLPPSVRGARVYFEVNAAPYAAGESSFIGETLQRLGLRNIVPRELGPFPRISPEFVVRADPDLIMVGDAGFAGMAQRPGWTRMRAIENKRVCVFEPAVADIMVRAGPRIAEAAQAIARCASGHLP
ncbi:MAG: ABC transporter substrate-binding protein [Rhodoferax sp.]|nr:ABC transporter substrate-binding protein [Rhodoferax sp.]